MSKNFAQSLLGHVSRAVAITGLTAISFLAQGQSIPSSIGCDMPERVNGNEERSSAPLPQNTGSWHRLRVAVHFILDENGEGNFTEFDNGYPNSATALPTNAFEIAEAVIDSANYVQAHNPVQWSQAQGFWPQIARKDKKYDFVLAGVFVHRTSETKLRLYSVTNRGSELLNNTYGYKPDSVINLYLMDHEDGSYIKIAGIAGSLGYQRDYMWTKMVSLWRNWGSGQRFWSPQTLVRLTGDLLCHEIGHLANLDHTFWSVPQCSDTAPDDGSWDSSNNTMGYNWTQAAMSPCQIGKALAEIGHHESAYIESSGCRPAMAFATMPAAICANEPLYLDARASYAEDTYSLEISELKWNGSSYNVLNQWGQLYTGEAAYINLKALYAFQSGCRYRVTLTTHNACRDDVAVNEVEVYNPLDVNAPCNLPDNRPALAPKSLQKTLQLTAAPNPATEMVTLRYFAPTAGESHCRIYRVTGELVADVINALQQPGWQTLTWPVKGSVAPGVYRVELTVGTHKESTRLVVNP